MSASEFFFNLNALEKGIRRELGDEITAHIFPAEQSMASVVHIAPNAKGTVHSHPQEQWSILIEGSAIRIHNGEEIAVAKGDFWVAPGNSEHGIIGGPEFQFLQTLTGRVTALEWLHRQTRGSAGAAGRGDPVAPVQ